MTMLALALAGVLAGAIHVASGADHLAAVAPLAAADRRRAWRTGAGWGVGHGGGVALVAALAFGLRAVVPLDRLAWWGERWVGITLVGIGLWALVRAFGAVRARSDPAHDHVHASAEPPDLRGRHVHLHAHGGILHAHEHRHRRARGACLIGLLHGTAGGGHVLGVIPALALPTVADALVYLIGFGAGTVALMIGFAVVVGETGVRFARVGPRAWGSLLGGCGATSLAVGILWLAP